MYYTNNGKRVGQRETPCSIKYIDGEFYYELHQYHVLLISQFCL